MSHDIEVNQGVSLVDMVENTMLEIVMKSVNRTHPVNYGKTRQDYGVTRNLVLAPAELNRLANMGQFAKMEVEFNDVRIHTPMAYTVTLKEKISKGKKKIFKPLTVKREDLMAMFENDTLLRRKLSQCIKALENISQANAEAKDKLKPQLAKASTGDEVNVILGQIQYKTLTHDLANKSLMVSAKDFGLNPMDAVRYVLIHDQKKAIKDEYGFTKHYDVLTVDDQCKQGGYVHSAKIFEGEFEPSNENMNRVFLNINPFNIHQVKVDCNAYYCQTCQANRSNGRLEKNGNRCDTCYTPRGELRKQTSTIHLPEIRVGKNVDGEMITGLRYNGYGGIHFTAVRFGRKSQLVQMFDKLKSKTLEPVEVIKQMVSLKHGLEMRTQIDGKTKWVQGRIVPVLYETKYGEMIGLTAIRASLCHD